MSYCRHILFALALCSIRLSSAQTLFSVVTQQMPTGIRDAGEVALGNAEEGDHEELEDVADSVSAGDLWDDEAMMKMLGMEDSPGEKGEDQGNVDEGHSKDSGGPEEVPTLLSALYQKMNMPGSDVIPARCKIPGMNGNVVRVLTNKGSILHEDQHQTLVELRFRFKNSLHEYENITQAELQLPLSGTLGSQGEIEAWMIQNGLLALPRYKLEIYWLNENAWSKMWDTVKKQRGGEGDGNTATSDKGSSSLLDMASLAFLGKPIHTKYQSSVNPGKKSNSFSIDVKPLVERWRKLFFHSRRQVVSRALLSVTIENPSILTKQCRRVLPARPKLLLVSLDTRQCPLPVTSQDSTQHNDVTTDDDVDARSRPKRAADKSGERNDVIGDDPMMRMPENESISIEGRSTRPLSRSKRSSVCKRHPMYVSFDDVGWDEWIIAPRGYHAYRCAGDCPFHMTGRLNGTNHAVLLTMMNSMEPWSTPPPCCIPTVLSPISLLYFDRSGNVVLRQYEDMVVSACGCR